MDADEHLHGPRIGGGQECLLCPICVLYQALTTARPEVTQHLLAASRELLAAVKSLVDATAEAHEDTDDSQRLRRIRIE